MNLMQAILKYIMTTSYEDLGTPTVEAIKKSFLDTLGVLIAGSSAEGIQTVLDLIMDWGGKREGSILVYGGKVPIPNAALINCTMARALDFDDVHDTGGGHLSATFIPVSLVLAEYIKRPIKGRDLILAIAIGSDLSCRLRCAMTTYPGWQAETFAPFGIIAMAGKLIGFQEEQLINGMGIAYSQCSTNLQGYVDGALSVRLQQGLGAKAGILATLLAERGFTGARDVFQGMYGFYPLYIRNEYDPEVITDQIGKRFEIVNNSIKPYPCCKYTHIPIYATLKILNDHSIHPKEIKEITVFTNSKAYNVTGTGDNKYYPKSIVDAQFSIPYTVATAAINKRVFLDDFTITSITRSEILELAERVRVRVDPELDKIAGFTVPNRVELESNEGNRFSEYVEIVKGHPKNPMTMAECIDKFKECVRFSARPLDQGKLMEIIQLICDLEKVNDVRKMVELLVGGQERSKRSI